MMKAVEAGEIETCVVFAFSRYARSVSHMLKGLEVFKKSGTNFSSLTEKLDLDTSLGQVVFVIISAIAQLERDFLHMYVTQVADWVSYMRDGVSQGLPRYVGQI